MLAVVLRHGRLPYIVGFVLLAPAAGYAGKQKAGGRVATAPAPVYVAKAVRKVVPLMLDAIGVVEPLRSASVRAQVTGVLPHVNFQEGCDIAEGDFLFEIAPRPFQHALRQAEADFERARVQAGAAAAKVKRYAALHKACLVRFRPSMMTTLAALAGTLPIAIGLGAGADARCSLGIAVAGGLLVSQLLTLFITPIIYVALDGLVRRRSHRAPAGALPVPTH